MTTAFDGVQDLAQQRPLSIAACIIIAFPGSVVFVTGRSILLPTTASTISASSTTPYCTVRIPLELALPTSALGESAYFVSHDMFSGSARLHSALTEMRNGERKY
jgi:hypothetical protein